jgi:hypothetical protein
VGWRGGIGVECDFRSVEVSTILGDGAATLIMLTERNMAALAGGGEELFIVKLLRLRLML